MAKISWSQALADYLKNDTESYSSIALRYGVSKQAVVKRAVKERWQELRQRTLLKVDQKLPEMISESIVQTKARHAARGKLLQDKAMGVLESSRPVGSYLDALRMLSTGVRIEREALGLNSDEVTDPYYEKFKRFRFIFDLTPDELKRFVKAAMAKAGFEETTDNMPPTTS